MNETTPVRQWARHAVSTSSVGTPRGSNLAYRLVAVLLVWSAVGVVGLLVWDPWPGRNTLVYEDLAPLRGAVWIGTLLDGVLMGIVGVTFGLAVVLLVPARGSRWAAVAAVCAGLGGLLFTAGISARAFLVWYATAPQLPAGSGEAVLDYVVAEHARLYAVPAAGFLLVTAGVLLACVAMWRGQVAPRWLLVSLAVTTTLPLLWSSDTVLDVVQSVQSLFIAGIAVLVWRTAAVGGGTGDSGR